MPKGLVTQGVCILLDREASLDAIVQALSDFPICNRVDDYTSWEIGGPTVVVEFRADKNGLVAVDTIGKPWPDHMGNPDEEPMLFAAWAIGQFGPFAFPGGLERAADQCVDWEEGETIPGKHRAFVRLRVSYTLGGDDDAPIMPDDYDPVPELDFLLRMADALLSLPGALCYFNPNGEVLLPRDGLRERMLFAEENHVPALDAWSNVRVFSADDAWLLMDTVGNGQLDLPDIEACFHGDSYDPGEVDSMLRNLTLYLLNEGDVIEDGDTLDGPGNVRWQMRRFEDSLNDPPRNVLRCFPQDGREIPEDLLRIPEGDDEYDDEGADDENAP